ncbi:cysteine hydrolase family protein [Pseudonocardia adelaidensis]|uniref:Cysteine hydrolase n=1 Tax=Pseudonocardia adelaidensis TaxID=648754 RepID=A0ABP9P1N0_9PSEU
MHEHRGLRIRTELSELCDPSRLALLVYDMQVGIVAQIDHGDRVTANVARVLSAARRAGVRTFFTRHMSLPVAASGVSAVRTAMAWQRKTDPRQIVSPFPRDSPQFAIVPEVQPGPDDVVFDKIAMSAFVGTPLEFALRDCAIEAFAVVGVAMEVGIEPTARHATDLGFVPIIVTDACGYGHEDAAKRSLETLEFAGGTLQTDTATLAALLES